MCAGVPGAALLITCQSRIPRTPEGLPVPILPPDVLFPGAPIIIDHTPTGFTHGLTSTMEVEVTGVGGTGVVTVGQLITMAAHLEGKGTSVLDFMGFAQKFGPVLSYIRIARQPADINQVRIEQARAELARLAALLKKADTAYHTHDAPVMSDAEYDALKQRNQAIEDRFPDLKRSDSPSETIGAAPSEGFTSS